MTHRRPVSSATDPAPLATRQRHNVRFGAWISPGRLTPGIPFWKFSIGRLRREMCRSGSSWPAPPTRWRHAPVVVCLSDVGQSMPDVKALLALKNPRRRSWFCPRTRSARTEPNRHPHRWQPGTLTKGRSHVQRDRPTHLRNTRASR